MKQGVDQRTAITVVFRCARAHVYHHSRRLIDHGEVVIFVDDVERDLLGYSAHRGPFNGAPDCDVLISVQPERGFSRLAVHQHLLLSNQLLNVRAASGR